MHFLAAFFAFLFSFCQAQSVHHSQTFVPPGTALAISSPEPGSRAEYAPTRRELAQDQMSRSYAESAWRASAHPMNASFDGR
jgi:hypothetical protein